MSARISFVDSLFFAFALTSAQGDLHDRDFDEYARSITLSGAGISGASLKAYVLTLYPNDEFFALYRTSSPRIATIGAVAIVVLISLIFILYDLAVRT